MFPNDVCNACPPQNVRCSNVVHHSYTKRMKSLRHDTTLAWKFSTTIIANHPTNDAIVDNESQQDQHLIIKMIQSIIKVITINRRIYQLWTEYTEWTRFTCRRCCVVVVVVVKWKLRLLNSDHVDETQALVWTTRRRHSLCRRQLRIDLCASLLLATGNICYCRWWWWLDTIVLNHIFWRQTSDTLVCISPLSQPNLAHQSSALMCHLCVLNGSSIHTHS